ncbi:MAG: Uma2 family endonuclease [Bacteroidia bacterium]|nr:Uma2 family endonuclease [Bacteroidia bacterium]
MGIPQLKQDKFTYADYLTWDDQKRWELIEGWAYDMSPAPKRKHQSVSIHLARIFSSYLKGKRCKVFAAPFDVCLCEKNEADEEIENVVQPDISIFCDTSKLNERGAKGSPDLIVEILSENTCKKDLGTKLILYQKFGVKEYWIIDPETDTLTVYKLDTIGRYQIEKDYSKEDKVTVGIFPDLTIEMAEVFEE